MTALGGRNVAVVGLGASGYAAARLTLHHGGAVYASDSSDTAALCVRASELAELGAEVTLGGHDIARILASDIVVASPGIPPSAPVLAALGSERKRWVSEPEFAFSFFRSSLIAVTGTNGKTTTCALAAHMLREAGMTVGLGGNIGGGFGPPASGLARLDPAPRWLVVEMSSYQLGGISRFRPDIGVVTNLAPDHLDRYPARAAYYADKARLFANARADSRWVLARDVPAMLPLSDRVPGRRFFFDASDRCLDGAGRRSSGSAAFVRDGWMIFIRDGREHPVLPVADLSLAGHAGLANTMAAGLAAVLAGAGLADVARAARTFPPLPHRMEPVVRRDGVLWVNDSKATNVASAAAALRSFDRPVVSLLGGRDKGDDLAPLVEACRGRVRRAVVYGEARTRLEEALEGAVPVTPVAGRFEDAVKAAAASARHGDVLLLAPACASFDMFSGYDERGRLFAALAGGDA